MVLPDGKPPAVPEVGIYKYCALFARHSNVRPARNSGVMPPKAYLQRAKMPKDFPFYPCILGTNQGHYLASFFLPEDIHWLQLSLFRLIQTLLQMGYQTKHVQAVLLDEKPPRFYVFYRRMGNHRVLEA